MPSLLDTQTNSLSSTEVSIGYIENYTEDSTTTSTQLEDLGTQESADLQLSPSDIWLAAPSTLDLAPDDDLLSTSITNEDVLYEPSAELVAQGETYDSSPTLSVLAASTSQSSLDGNTWDQTSTLPDGQLEYTLNTDGSLGSTSPTLSTTSGSTSFGSGSNSSLYLATTDSTAIAPPFSLTSSGSPTTSSTTTASSSLDSGTDTTADSGGTPTTSTDSGSTPTSSTDSSNTSTISTDSNDTSTTSTDFSTPFTSSTDTQFTADSSSTTSTSSLRQTSSASGSDPVPVPFDMHSSIGLLIVSLIIARKVSNQRKAKRLIGVCCSNP